MCACVVCAYVVCACVVQRCSGVVEEVVRNGGEVWWCVEGGGRALLPPSSCPELSLGHCEKGKQNWLKRLICAPVEFGVKFKVALCNREEGT